MASPIGLGTDLIEVQRIADSIERHGEAFLARCFTDREQADARRTGEERAPERFAARFACKEAVLKALGTGWSQGIGWTDVEVVTDEVGAPGIVLTGRAAEIAGQRGITSWLCSLTHTASLASATVIGSG